MTWRKALETDTLWKPWKNHPAILFPKTVARVFPPFPQRLENPFAFPTVSTASATAYISLKNPRKETSKLLLEAIQQTSLDPTIVQPLLRALHRACNDTNVRV